MLYLAIDQHSKQITVCVRNEEGDTVLSRQVSTRPEKIEVFLKELLEMGPMRSYARRFRAPNLPNGCRRRPGFQR